MRISEIQMRGHVSGSGIRSCGMPNRGPVQLSLSECTALLGELPPPMDPKEAEDDEDRQRIALQAKIRTHIEEPKKALEEAGGDGEATCTVILTIDEVDEILDCLPPPPALDAVRTKLGELKRSLA